MFIPVVSLRPFVSSLLAATLTVVAVACGGGDAASDTSSGSVPGAEGEATESGDVTTRADDPGAEAEAVGTTVGSVADVEGDGGSGGDAVAGNNTGGNDAGGNDAGGAESSSESAAGSDLNAAADGSGCEVESDTSLPDGLWYGTVSVIDDGRIDFDLACWFSGAAAVDASAADGAESPPPNDYYVRNNDPQLRILEVAAGAEVTWLEQVGDPASATTGRFDDWVLALADRPSPSPAVWLTTEDGAVVAIEEQYVP